MASEYRKAIGFDDPEFSDRILVIQHHPAISATTRSSSIQALDHTDDSGNAININGKRPLVKGEESAAKRSKEEGAEEKEETKEEEAKEEVKKVVYRKVHVSKLLLSRASAFFQTLFTGPMKEGRETEVAIHVKTEQEASTFVEMLRWIYEPQFPAATTGADYFRLLMLADQFQVGCLLDICVEFLQRDIAAAGSVDLICAVLTLPSAGVFGTLWTAAENALISKFKNMQAVVEQPEFLNLPLHALVLLLKSDRLEVPSENVVILNIYKWVAAAPERAELKGELVKHLRLFHCTADFYIDLVACCPWLWSNDNNLGWKIRRWFIMSPERRVVEAKTSGVPVARTHSTAFAHLEWRIPDFLTQLIRADGKPSPALMSPSLYSNGYDMRAVPRLSAEAKLTGEKSIEFSIWWQNTSSRAKGCSRYFLITASVGLVENKVLLATSTPNNPAYCLYGCLLRTSLSATTPTFLSPDGSAAFYLDVTVH